MVRISGRESQHLITSKLFDLIHVEKYSLDVRAYITILYTYGRLGKYNRAIYIFEKMKESGVDLTLVTYNVMLDVYGKMGRSWNKILDLLDEMRSKGLQLDEFICSTVISACGRQGMLDEARNSFTELKLNGYKLGTITYNAILQLGFIDDERVAVMDTMPSKGISPNAITYTIVIDAYGKTGKEDEALKLFGQMKELGCVPNVCTSNSVLAKL
ncbi:hypothetical protein RJT34_30809 [Clitoria ternatea]|uniref:Pentatricopeptide repeat-containing protein n=1 Tax=Clitoria ternatea TaxID=43366 RepID=A0AAN9ET51_CLITE